jgi:poly(3-hydroxybutyrate) depolymerase
MNSISIHKIALICFLISILPLFQACKKMQKYQMLITPFSVVDKLGNSRDYRIYLPEREANKEVPLLVYFHGVRSECFKQYAGLKNYTGSPVEETGLIEFCKSNKIALLVPEPRYEYKFLNCRCKGWSPFNKEIDGIEKIIDLVVEKYSIEKKKIF